MHTGPSCLPIFIAYAAHVLIMFWHNFGWEGGAPCAQWFLLQVVSEHASSKYLDKKIFIRILNDKNLSFFVTLPGVVLTIHVAFLQCEKSKAKIDTTSGSSHFWNNPGSRMDRSKVSNHNSTYYCQHKNKIVSVILTKFNVYKQIPCLLRNRVLFACKHHVNSVDYEKQPYMVDVSCLLHSIFGFVMQVIAWASEREIKLEGGIYKWKVGQWN